MASQPERVISLYRKIMKVGRKWDTPREREYIQEEARKLFRQNQDLKNQEKIEKKLFEAETRLELGLHYHNPYPRLYNLSKVATPETVRDSPNKYIKSAYMDSYFDNGKGDF